MAAWLAKWLLQGPCGAEGGGRQGLRLMVQNDKGDDF